MSELQAEAVVEPTQTEPQQNDNPEGSESAPEQEKVTFSEAQQKLVDDIAAKKTFKIREAERETDKLRQELAAAQAKIPQEVRPNIPGMPDEFDENRDQLIAQRDEAIRQSAGFDAREEQRLEQQEATNLQRQQAKQAEISQVFTDYEAQGKKLGVDAQELLAAGTAVGAYGLSDEIVLYIAKDDQGPLITTYLHKNPEALETIRQLDSLSAAAYISNQVKPNASALGNKQPTAPDPIETLNGSGVASRQRGPKGATYT